jgi:hypothetical protein
VHDLLRGIGLSGCRQVHQSVGGSVVLELWRRAGDELAALIGAVGRSHPDHTSHRRDGGGHVIERVGIVAGQQRYRL